MAVSQWATQAFHRVAAWGQAAPEARQRLFLGREQFRRAEQRQRLDFFLKFKED